MALLLALAVPMQTTLAQVRLPSLGESAAVDLPVGTERRLGHEVMDEIRRDPQYLDDPVLQEYVSSVFQPLVAAARKLGNIGPDIDHAFAWQVFLLDDRAVNAFALPGGYIGVYLGMIALTDTEDELASVLAHELSHVTQRHIARKIVNAQHSSMVGMAALVLAILAASRSGNADAAQAAMVGGQAAAIQGQINFSREVESEADRMGFGVLDAAHFDTAGMYEMFQKLQTASRINDDGSFPFLRDHPLTTERIAEARSRALTEHGGPPAPPLRPALMQMRAKVLMDRDPQALRRWEQLGSGIPRISLRDRLAAMYGGALAASLLGHPAVAERHADDALALARTAVPREPLAERDLQLLQVQLAIARHDPAAALRVLDSISVDANGRAPLLMRAQAALALQQYGSDAAATAAALRASTEALHTWVAEHGNDATAWGLLSQTSEAIGQRLRSLRASAEAHAAVGDLVGAIDRLHAGQKLARDPKGEQDFIEASVIDARLRELQAQRRQQLRDARGGGDGFRAFEQ